MQEEALSSYQGRISYRMRVQKQPPSVYRLLGSIKRRSVFVSYQLLPSL